MTLIVADATIHTSPGQTRRGDLQASGAVIGGQEVPADQSMLIEAAGCSVVPLLVDTVFETASPPAAESFDLMAGHPATFAVIRGTADTSAIRNMLVVSPRDLVAVVVHGELVVRQGQPVRPAGIDGLSAGDARLGAWTDPRRDMTQYLTADGRYSETRSGRRNAYTGRFWLDEDRITYLDDTGFWAFGQYHDGTLHHAGFVLQK
ncbi:Atu4866 domain-containing protein [Nesterenkonia sp. PF2B19]|uniref:Atu4866 domain-containing protein n=1 Tax=Nesterenkonia sp. PF2B19 TaxID=1881858 RepID=UPI000872D33C|nr:Atu4866 domain-containing protein [Nesterenkonia sp. PF2B19]